VEVNFSEGSIKIASRIFTFGALPEKLKQILEKGGLVNWMKEN